MQSRIPAIAGQTVILAEKQPEYETIVGVVVRNPAYMQGGDRAGNTIVLAFEPSEAERALIASGERIYLSLLTFGAPMQPVLLTVGAADTAAIFGVDVVEQT